MGTALPSDRRLEPIGSTYAPTLIFLLGLPRSGTSFVTQIFNEFSCVSIFDEFDFIRSEHLFNSNPAQFIERARAFTRLPRNEIKELTSGCETFTECASELFRRANPAKSLKFIGDKLPGYIDSTVDLAEKYNNPIFFYVKRNPLAVAASLIRYKDAAERSSDDFWICDTLEEAIRFIKAQIPKIRALWPRIVPISYEDAVQSPVAFRNEISRLLNAPDASVGTAPELHRVEGIHLRNGKVPIWKAMNFSHNVVSRSNVAPELTADQRLSILIGCHELFELYGLTNEANILTL